MFGSVGVFKVAIRKVFHVSVVRVALLQCMLVASVTWGQDASTGALWGVVLDARGAAIGSADIVAIRVEAGRQEDVQTESASIALISGLGPRLTSHLRVQFSQDREQSFPNLTGTRTSIYSWMEDFGQSSILPRQTREHRFERGGNFEFESRSQSMEIWRRRDDDVGL